MNTLNPGTFPLHGSRLIEASAGTGKTYTLALLYVRLVLGHGHPGEAHPRPLLPEEILVVTFTKAATKELRERIRARLVEAAAVFADTSEREEPDASADPLLALRNDIPVDHRPVCALRLRQAAEAMDEAAIFTIHGWCQRMLQEHAFATRGLFERELTPDQEALFAELLRDYWRQTFYPLSVEAARHVQAVVASPDALLARLSGWLKQRDTALSYAGTVLERPDLHAELERVVKLGELENAARKAWRDDQSGLEEYLRGIRPHLNGRTHGSADPDSFDSLLADIARWAADDQVQAPDKLGRFATGRFQFKKTAPVQEAEDHQAFRALAAWQDAVEQQQRGPGLGACILAHAADWLREELPRRLAQRAEMGFNELLLDLAAALAPDERGESLAAMIRSQFPAALIDEFQDTDPLQYRIFDRVYRVADNDSGTLLAMIGDPKQAIYSFRGADIHTYLQARQAVAGRIYRLERNYRSTEPMVKACNRLFRFAEDAHPRGAFRFRPEAEADNPVPFAPVEAQGRGERLLIEGADSPALTFWTLKTGDGPITKDSYLQAMAERSASEIRRWLDRPGTRRTGFLSADGESFQPLQPRDIAILVRDRNQADALYTALARRGIASVYLSERNSVFEGQEARDLVHWLRACAEPANESLIRNALATTTYGLSPSELAKVLDTEASWEDAVERFRGYRRLWRQRGVLAMLRSLLHEAGLPARLLDQPRGERVLTNLLHLSEWLQQAAERLDGEQALIRHLVEHLDSRDESATVRLESDAERVQIVTIHKSKGLEYPLVLLPFICTWRPVDGKTPQVVYRKNGQRLREIAGRPVCPEAWTQADDERLGEDMRLLYVAATRAKFGLWLGMGLLKHGNVQQSNMHRGAMGYLLAGDSTIADAGALAASLDRLCQGSEAGHLLACDAPLADPGALPEGPAESLEPAREASHRAFERWWIASYSALQFSTGADTSNEATVREESGQGDSVASTGPGTTAAADPATGLHDLPRGSTYGTFLHGLLEWAAGLRYRDGDRILRGYPAAVVAHAERRDTLARRCRLRGLTAWIDRLDAWLPAYLQQPLRLEGLEDVRGRTPGFRLVDLSPQQMQVEMEFWIESRGVDAGELDRLVCRHCLPGKPRRLAEPARLNGMLKGFIDLVFEHDGRYFVLDWKSNWLGDHDLAYTRDVMAAAVLQHRYDLQYALYLLALHRQLQARLPDYDYDRHMGGAVYAFLRGHRGPTAGLFVERPPRALIEQLDHLFAATTARESA